MDFSSDPREECKYGVNCYQKNPRHWERFKHPDPPRTKRQSPELEEDDETDTTQQLAASKKVKIDEPQQKDSSDDSSSESNSDDDDDDDTELPSSPLNVKENIKQKFLVDMPEDFYLLWDFCKTLNDKKPEDAFLKHGLQLVGPYDVLSGKLKGHSPRLQSHYLRHWRYYYDPPEFQTVLKTNTKSLLHYGYFRDDPNDLPVFMASNKAAENGQITSVGENVFAAVHSYLKEKLDKSTPFDRVPLQKLVDKVVQWAESKNIDLQTSTSRTNRRTRHINSKTFHGAGMVVPVDSATEVGYREIPETDAKMKRLMKFVVDSPPGEQQDAHVTKLQELITLVQYANDEGDFGMGLELGLDVFTYGGSEVLDRIARHLLTSAYALLNRHEFATIIKAHLASRQRGDDLSIAK